MKKILSKIKIQKIDFIFLIFFLVAGILIYNLYILQVVQGKYYNDKVLSQNNKYLNSKVFYRGNIYFQGPENKKILVATQKVGWILAINPSTLDNPDIIFEKLNKIVKIDKKDFKKKAAKKNDPYEEIKKRLSAVEKEKIRNLKLKGVILSKIKWRHYPFGSLAGKTLGFLNVNRKGVYGLEKYYENILKRDEKKIDQNIFFSLFSKDKKNNLFSQKKISREGNLISSLDLEIQKFSESILKKIDEKYKSEYSALIIMKAETGEIITLADSKNFNLNTEKKDYRNQFIEHIFEVGSIIKPLVVATALETGVIDLNFSYNDKGCISVFKYRMCNFDKKARGKNTNLKTILNKSLNLGMIEIGKKIGQKKLLESFINLGLAEESGIDLDGEVPSIISSLNQKNETNFATASFGQGIAFTPMGIFRALNSLANDGFLVEPHLIKKIDYGDLIPSKKFEGEKKQVFSSQTIRNIKNILIKEAKPTASTIEKNLSNNYSIATKTGTAQIPDVFGGYEKDYKNHFFFGFFPTEAKVEDRYSILLFTIRPQGARYSSDSLTEPFYEIVNFIISNKNISPDKLII